MSARAWKRRERQRGDKVPELEATKALAHEEALTTKKSDPLLPDLLMVTRDCNRRLLGLRGLA